MNTQILSAEVEFFHQPFLKPLQLSSGLITEITEARATVRVRVGSREAMGRGAIYLSDLWAWPEPSLTHTQRDAVLRRLCNCIAGDLESLCGGEAAHPLELGLRLHHALCNGNILHEFDDVPLLARAMCGSPFDAAIHDATGQALHQSAFRFYDEHSALPSADGFFASGNACAAIRHVIEKPCAELPAWLIVGARDSLAADVAPAVRQRGYRCFKLKLLGRDNAADVARTIEVFRAVRSYGVLCPRLSVDSNEANPDAGSVLDYLERLRAADAETFDALEYLEQPTARDITRSGYDWHAVAALKPVLLDEGLTSLELLDVAIAQGWSGLALKTCKGHSFALVAAAWAREHNLMLTLQDLTNPGLAAIHAALFAAHIPMQNGVELNSPQFTPAANAAYLPRLSKLFEPCEGVHCLPSPLPDGLGSTW